jgi:hypothetical protein
MDTGLSLPIIGANWGIPNWPARRAARTWRGTCCKKRLIWWVNA